jgi:protein subunit release factor A
MKKLLFSLTAKDFEFQTFCTGGHGGQHRNAKQNGVRCIHLASGARAEHRDGRDQRKNKEEAFRKCCETETFKKWHKIEAARRMGIPVPKTEEEIQQDLDEQMQPWYLKEEYW